MLDSRKFFELPYEIEIDGIECHLPNKNDVELSFGFDDYAITIYNNKTIICISSKDDNKLLVRSNKNISHEGKTIVFE